METLGPGIRSNVGVHSGLFHGFRSTFNTYDECFQLTMYRVPSSIPVLVNIGVEKVICIRESI